LSDVATWSRGCLTMQGYGALSDVERRRLWLGLRFAPALCLTGIAAGTALGSAVVLLAMAGTAFVGGFVTSKHPFDHVYDAVVRPLLGGPRIPASPAPRRFACQLATPWIVAVAVAFVADAPIVAWVLAVPLLAVGAVVSLTNWCLPSLIHGLLHRREARGAAA